MKFDLSTLLIKIKIPNNKPLSDIYGLIDFFDVGIKQHVAVNQFRGKPVEN